MRRVRIALDFVYKICGVVAAIALAMIAVLILAQIVGRLFGVLVPGVNEAAAFLLAATTFLALAYSFRAGSHIRVSVVLHYLPPRLRRLADLLSVAVATALIGYFAWYTWKLVQDSIKFNEVSDGLLAIPLAIPQSAMLVGLIVLAVALVEEFFNILFGGTPSFDDSEDVVLEKRDDASADLV